MPNLRVFGTEISGNRQGKKNLSPEARAAVCSSVAAGQSPTAVARAFKISRGTVYNTIKRFQQHNSFESRPRTGRPRSLSTREERYLVQIARRFPRVSWQALVHLDGIRISLSTIKRIMRRKRLRKWRSKQRPKLTASHARERRAFCRYWLQGGRIEQLTSVCVSHELGPYRLTTFRGCFLMRALSNQYQTHSAGSSGLAMRPIAAILLISRFRGVG